MPEFHFLDFTQCHHRFFDGFLGKTVPLFPVRSGDGNGINFPCPWYELFSWFLGEQTSSRSHVSAGLGTMLFGVSGNCEEREVTSLQDEFPKEPDSE